MKQLPGLVDRARMVFVVALLVTSAAACGDDTSSGGAGGSGGTAEGGAAGGPAAGGAAAGGAGEGGSGGAPLCSMFGSDCTEGDVCCDEAGQTGQCFAFGMGSKCTIPCPPDPADCPNNGMGCNNMAPPVCKAGN